MIITETMMLIIDSKPLIINTIALNMEINRIASFNLDCRGFYRSTQMWKECFH